MSTHPPAQPPLVLAVHQAAESLMKIRQLQLPDLPQWQALMAAGEAPPAYLENLQKYLVLPHRFTVFGVVAETAIPYIAAAMVVQIGSYLDTQALQPIWFGYVHDLMVAPAWRGQGYATWMLDRVSQEMLQPKTAPARDLKSLVASTRMNNEDAQRAFARAAYACVGQAVSGDQVPICWWQRGGDALTPSQALGLATWRQSYGRNMALNPAA